MNKMLQVKVSKKQVEADGIVSLELRAIDGSELPEFTAGAHIDVHLGQMIVRQYSLYGSTDDRACYRIGVYLDPESRGGSKFVHSSLNEGDVLTISEPRNHFPLVSDAKEVLLFAGGIGVTPIISMATELDKRGVSFNLHYSGRTSGRMGFVNYLLNASFSKNVHIHVDDGALEQKLNVSDVIESWIPGKHLYVCGPSGFMEFILTTAKSAGWPEDSLHREYFSAKTSGLTSDKSFEVEIKSSGKVFNIPESKTVADVLLENGVEISLSCEQGLCGTCLTSIISGIPDHRDMFLNELERSKNDCFTPCCSRSHSDRLVLDL